MDEDYVTRAGWRDPAGRPDLVDEVADQFERPAVGAWPMAASHAWGRPAVHWPTQSAGLRRSA